MTKYRFKLNYRCVKNDWYEVSVVGWQGQGGGVPPFEAWPTPPNSLPWPALPSTPRPAPLHHAAVTQQWAEGRPKALLPWQQRGVPLLVTVAGVVVVGFPPWPRPALSLARRPATYHLGMPSWGTRAPLLGIK